MSQTATARVAILGKEYHIACEEAEREELVAAARYLDGKMRLINDHGRVIGAERIAVMAALNIAHELIQAQNRNAAEQPVPVNLTLQVMDMQRKIDRALDSNAQLDLSLGER
jgi:cell division protein ZapA